MKYRIKFKGGGVQEYVVETVAGFDSVKDVMEIIRKNFGFKDQLLVYDQNHTKLSEHDIVQSGRTFIVRRQKKNSDM